jgi:uncharacterized protein
MNIVVAGGTGFIGKALCSQLLRSGHRLTILTRTPAAVERLFGSTVKATLWDARNSGGWERSLNGAQAVINLAGAGIADARWTDRRKQLLTESRIYPTRLLVQACARLRVRPEIFVSASGIGFYGPHGDEMLDESSGRGRGFLSDLCVQWESTALEAASQGIRVVCMRTGMVLGSDGGALPRMSLPFRLFLGGPVMPGTQWVSWIHRDDLIGLIEWALATPAVSGPINGVAPSPVTMAEFCRLLGLVLRRPSWLPVPEFVLNTALGEMGSMMTTGQRAVPAVAEGHGYPFRFREAQRALQAIFSSLR